MSKMVTAKRASDHMTSLSSVSSRVSKLETSVEVLGNRMTVLSDDITVVGRQQENFHQEWRDQKKREDEKVQSRQITVPAAFGMAFGLLSSVAIMAGVGNWVIDSKVNAATGPLVLRQDSLVDSLRNLRDEVTVTRSALANTNSLSAADRAVLQRHDQTIDSVLVRLRGTNDQVIRNEERLKGLEREALLWDRIKADRP